MSTEQVRTGSGATPPSGSEVYSKEDDGPSSHDHWEETPTTHNTRVKGRDRMLRGSRKYNVCIRIPGKPLIMYQFCLYSYQAFVLWCASQEELSPLHPASAQPSNFITTLWLQSLILHVIRTTCKHLDISRDGDSTTSLGSLFQVVFFGGGGGRFDEFCPGCRCACGQCVLETLTS